MWQMVTIAAIHAFLLLFGFVWPTPLDAAVLFEAASPMRSRNIFGRGRCALRRPRRCRRSTISSWCGRCVIGFLAWGDVPTVGLLVGSAIVVASGLFLLWHESGGRPSQLRAGMRWLKARISRPRLATSRVRASDAPRLLSPHIILE